LTGQHLIAGYWVDGGALFQSTPASGVSMPMKSTRSDQLTAIGNSETCLPAARLQRSSVTVIIATVVNGFSTGVEVAVSMVHGNSAVCAPGLLPKHPNCIAAGRFSRIKTAHAGDQNKRVAYLPKRLLNCPLNATLLYETNLEMKLMINHTRVAVVAALFCTGATAALGQTPCQMTNPDRLAGFSALNAMVFLDLPDPITTRATATLESSFVDQLISEDIRGFSKTWCEIGLHTMVIDFEVPVEDDAIKSILTRGVYVWDTTTEPIGWRIESLGERPVCARGDDPFAALCP
jgi:hypothetical protein